MVLADLQPSGIVDFPTDAPSDAIAVLPVLKRENPSKWRMGRKFETIGDPTSHMLDRRGMRLIDDEDEIPTHVQEDSAFFKKQYPPDEPGGSAGSIARPGNTSAQVAIRFHQFCHDGQEYGIVRGLPLVVLYPELPGQFPVTVERAARLAHEMIHVVQVEAGVNRRIRLVVSIGGVEKK